MVVSTDDLVDGKILQERRKYQPEFKAALDKFAKNVDSDYDVFTPKSQHHICRIFYFKVKNTDKKTNSILISTEKKNEIKLQDVIPVVKIIKLGHTARTDLVEGGLYMVPVLDVMGTRANLGYKAQLDMKSYNSTGEQLKIAGGAAALEEKVVALETNWAKYLFMRPWCLPEEKDFETYLVPEIKLICKWDYDQFLKTSEQEV